MKNYYVARCYVVTVIYSQIVSVEHYLKLVSKQSMHFHAMRR